MTTEFLFPGLFFALHYFELLTLRRLYQLYVSWCNIVIMRYSPMSEQPSLRPIRIDRLFNPVITRFFLSNILDVYLILFSLDQQRFIRLVINVWIPIQDLWARLRISKVLRCQRLREKICEHIFGHDLLELNFFQSDHFYHVVHLHVNVFAMTKMFCRTSFNPFYRRIIVLHNKDCGSLHLKFN